jgi:hypothetical protein
MPKEGLSGDNTVFQVRRGLVERVSSGFKVNRNFRVYDPSKF